MSLHPVFRPTGLYNLLPVINSKLTRGRQEDAHEFLVCLLSALDEHLVQRCIPLSKLDFCLKQTTAIGRIFSWWMQTNDTCVDCEETRSTYGPFSNFTVPLDMGSTQKAVTQCLEAIEIIEGFTCTSECVSKRCHRNMSFYSYPKVFKIVLNRFDNSGRKISSPMAIEKRIVVGKATYHFVSCIVHEGDYANKGHYTCLAVNSEGKLKHYNDAVVTDGQMNSKVGCGVYVVFYQLHHFQPESIKRSLANTPSKVKSPVHKKLQTSPFKKSFEKKI